MDHRRGACTLRTGPIVAPARPAEPAVQRAGWVRNPIDRFVLAKLEAEGLAPSPEADRATLIKRLSIDLVGLPPTPEEVDAFVADCDPEAYEKLVDRLLASPHYGERMALGWLDAARYADSNGFQQDGDTWQWIWRDWVVRALNADLPFDQFTIWQLAGDLLPDATDRSENRQRLQPQSSVERRGRRDRRRTAVREPVRPRRHDRHNLAGPDDGVRQCHDHKFDPITQRDYYGLLDAFNRVPESGTPQFFSSRIRVAAPFIEVPTEENKARIAEFESQISAAERGLESSPWTPPLKAGEQESLPMASPRTERAFPTVWPRFFASPSGEPHDDEKKSLDAGLRKHFDEKVRPEPGRQAAGNREVGGLKKQLGRLPGRQAPARDGHERRQAAADGDPHSRRVPEAGRESLVFNAELSAAAAQGEPGQSTWPCPMAGRARAPADCSRSGQPHVAAFLRDRAS